jgi:hypothetical protein
MKNILLALLVLIVIGLGGYIIFSDSPRTTDTPTDQNTATSTDGTNTDGQPVVNKEETVIGKSVEGRDIVAYHYGEGATELLFVGGIHGGYSWNTSLVAYQTMDYLKTHPEIIPSNLKVTVIPALNPDGLNKVVGTSTANFTASDVAPSQALQVAGRFNANTVDLNRNFDCDWQADATWQNKKVSGGSAAFSEPESQAIRNYVLDQKPQSVVVWYSASGGVFASNCHSGVLPETLTLTNLYADASGYKAYNNFNFYEVTGDMVNWLAKEKIPAISILLTTHKDTEWTKNKAGIEALLEYYAQ